MEQNIATSDLTLTAGTLTIGANALTINGAISQTSGILTGGSTSSVAFGGSGASTSLPAITLNNLSLDRSNGISLGGATSVAGTLTLTNGVLDLNSQVLSLGGNSWVSGSAADNNHVDATSGTFRKYFDYPSDFSYPVGDGALYSPILLNFTSGDFTAAYADINLYASKHPNNGSSTDFISRYWHVGTSGISAFDCDVTAQYADADITGTESNFNGAKWDGVSWLDLGPVNTATNEITATVSSFSDFTASGPSVFPVEWLSLSATPVNGQVKVDWSTATEVNSDYFGVERSTDQKFWNELGTVKAAGTTSSPSNYSFTDRQPTQGRNFYRLKQVDVNGNFSYSPQVEALIHTQTFRAYPTPVTDVLHLELGAAAYQVSLIDVSGRELKTWSGLTGNSSVSVNEMPAGVYFIRVTAPGVTPWQQMILKK